MYEPLHRLKFSQYSSYVDQIRAGAKYFVEQRGRKAVCAMYQDTDFGKDVLAKSAGPADRGDEPAARRHHGAQTDRHRLFRGDRQAARRQLRSALCWERSMRDTTLILSTAHKAWMERGIFWARSPAMTRRSQPRPATWPRDIMRCRLRCMPIPTIPGRRYRRTPMKQRSGDKFGFDINYLGETGYVSAQIATEALRRAGRDLTLDSLIAAMESLKDFKDIFGATYTFTPTDHHGTTKAFLSVVHDGRWVPVMPEALAY